MTFKEFFTLNEKNYFDRRGGDTVNMLSIRKRTRIKPIKPVKPHMGMMHNPISYIKK